MLFKLKSFLEKINLLKDKLFFPFIKRFWPRFIFPNHLTILRIILGIVLIILLLSGFDNRLGLICIFVVAALCDLFDGVVARALDRKSRLGAYLDSMADKVLIIPIVIYMLYKDYFWLLAILLLLESIFALGFLYHKMKNKTLETNIFGKTKMFLECIALGIIIFFDFPNSPSKFPIILLYMAVASAFLSAFLGLIILPPKEENA